MTQKAVFRSLGFGFLLAFGLITLGGTARATEDDFGVPFGTTSQTASAFEDPAATDMDALAEDVISRIAPAAGGDIWVMPEEEGATNAIPGTDLLINPTAPQNGATGTTPDATIINLPGMPESE